MYRVSHIYIHSQMRNFCSRGLRISFSFEASGRIDFGSGFWTHISPQNEGERDNISEQIARPGTGLSGRSTVIVTTHILCESIVCSSKGGAMGDRAEGAWESMGWDREHAYVHILGGKR